MNLKNHTAFQQDDTPHFHTHGQEIFSGNFTGWWVGSGGLIAWHTHSPDFTVLCSLMWELIQDNRHLQISHMTSYIISGNRLLIRHLSCSRRKLNWNYAAAGANIWHTWLYYHALLLPVYHVSTLVLTLAVVKVCTLILYIINAITIIYITTSFILTTYHPIRTGKYPTVTSGW